MKRANRSMEVFSLSAIDLFASAMGAFMLIPLIIFPFDFFPGGPGSLNRIIFTFVAACIVSEMFVQRVVVYNMSIIFLLLFLLRLGRN